MTMIKTNHNWRDFLHGFELPENQRSEFDYLDDSEYESALFIKYKGNFYCLDQFMRAPPEIAPWNGVAMDSYFSGVVIRIGDDCEQYQVGLITA